MSRRDLTEWWIFASGSHRQIGTSDDYTPVCPKPDGAIGVKKTHARRIKKGIVGSIALGALLYLLAVTVTYPVESLAIISASVLLILLVYGVGYVLDNTDLNIREWLS